MKKILATNPSNISAFIARVFLGVVVFPHGAQKIIGLVRGLRLRGNDGLPYWWRRIAMDRGFPGNYY